MTNEKKEEGITLVVRKLVSENECRLLAVSIARFICGEEVESDEGEVDIIDEHMPCETCLEFAVQLVAHIGGQYGIIPVALNDERIGDLILDAMGFEETQKPLLTLEQQTDDIITRAKLDMQRKRQEKRQEGNADQGGP